MSPFDQLDHYFRDYGQPVRLNAGGAVSQITAILDEQFQEVVSDYGSRSEGREYSITCKTADVAGLARKKAVVTTYWQSRGEIANFQVASVRPDPEDAAFTDVMLVNPLPIPGLLVGSDNISRLLVTGGVGAPLGIPSYLLTNTDDSAPLEGLPNIESPVTSDQLYARRPDGAPADLKISFGDLLSSIVAYAGAH